MSDNRKNKRFYKEDPNALFIDSAIMNDLIYVEYFECYKELYISEGTWYGLPDNIDPRFVELKLFEDGQVLAFTDDVLNEKWILPVANDGPLDMQGNMVIRKAYSSWTGYKYEGTPENSVVIYNNMLRTSSYKTASIFARKLSEIDRIIEVNTKAQKTPVLLSCCDEKQRLTLINLYKQYDGNQPFIFGDKKLDPRSISAIQTGAPYIADKLYELKTQFWNEGLTKLGIPNISYEKKERVIRDEVQRQLGGVIASRNSRRKARQQAAKQLSELWQMPITWEYDNDIGENVSRKTSGGDEDV